MPNRPLGHGGDNWITRLPKPLQEGFLHSWLHRVATHLVDDKGFTVGHAIATGVNAAKKACATGDLNWPGVQHINLASRAQACAAVSMWEAMKAASHRTQKSAEDVTEEEVEEVLKALNTQRSTGKLAELMGQDA